MPDRFLFKKCYYFN